MNYRVSLMALGVLVSIVLIGYETFCMDMLVQPAVNEGTDSSSARPQAVYMYNGSIRSAVLSTDEEHIFMVTYPHSICIVKTATGELVVEPLKLGNSVDILAVSPTGDYFCSGVWDDNSKKSILRIVAFDPDISEKQVEFVSPIRSLSFSVSSNTYILIGLENGIACVVEKTGGIYKRLGCATYVKKDSTTVGIKFGGPIDTVAFRSDCVQGATGSSDGIVCLWNIGAGRLIKEFPKQKGSINSVAIGPDGQVLIGSDDTAVRLFTRKSLGYSLKVFEGHTGPVTAVAFSHDGKAVLAGSSDGKVRLWNIETTKQLAELDFHTVAVTAILCTKDGTIITCSYDQKMCVWESVDFYRLKKQESDSTSSNTEESKDHLHPQEEEGRFANEMFIKKIVENPKRPYRSSSSSESSETSDEFGGVPIPAPFDALLPAPAAFGDPVPAPNTAVKPENATTYKGDDSDPSNSTPNPIQNPLTNQQPPNVIPNLNQNFPPNPNNQMIVTETPLGTIVIGLPGSGIQNQRPCSLQ